MPIANMKASGSAGAIRTLKIKSGVVKRLDKEWKSYVKEAESQSKRIEKMISDGADEYDIRKQKEVLAESEQMIPEVKARLSTAYQELHALLDGAKKDDELKDTEECKAAIDILDGVRLEDIQV